MSQWKWCAIDDVGKVIKGWFQDKENNKWYHLDETTGVMNTGWFQDRDGRWYYLDEKNGDMKTGWVQLKEIWYYLEPNSNGYMGSCYIYCTTTINGKTYTFDANGHMVDNSLVSDKCVNFVKFYEGFFDHAYDDGTGVMTIGYGTIKPEYVALNYCTEEQATLWLKEEINVMAEKIKNDLDSKNVTLNQNEFDSLCSMSYNIGINGLLSSTLYSRICQGVRDDSLRENFRAWSKAGGQRLEGLFRRRTQEAEMFLNADYTGNSG